MIGTGTFEFLDAVTSDLAFVARGESVDGVFAAAAEAVLAATVEDPRTVRRWEERPVVIEESDIELLLLAFLNELVFLRDAEELLLHVGQIAIRLDGRVRLEGTLVGERLDHRRHRVIAEVKACTAHGLRVARTREGWEARATLDV